ncbi:MAG: Crp/Fnr family transcriptional regulator [Rhizobiaceae bacterium]|nr:Crp/Fnr family transcriptional regulator [Rhizobiaceae bacterium]
MSERTEIIQSAIWASELTTDEFERAARGITERRFDKGNYLFHRGDKVDYWHGVVTGLVKMSSVSQSGKAITFAGIGAGGWFGEGSVLKDEWRRYDLVAIRNTHALLMNRATFMWLYENSVGFNRFLVRQLNERLAQFIATTEYERLLDPKARVARQISWLGNPLLCPHVGNVIEITQDELALLATVSRPLVNRSLQELAQEGLLDFAHGAITVINRQKLGDYGAIEDFS